MQISIRRFISNIGFRRFIAAAFLIFLLAEWGSHSVAFAHSISGEGHSIQCEENGHDDLCETLIRCGDGPRQEQMVPNPGHDVTQRNPFFDLFDPDLLFAIHKDPRIPRTRVGELSRPVSPPFQPPQNS